jgi:protein-tyrosine phosphatase
LAVPHSRCNWIVANNILVGAEPIRDTLNGLLKVPIRYFIDLTDNDTSYEAKLPQNVTIHRFPIRKGFAPNKSRFRKIVDLILNLLNDNKGVIYIHCRGGHGRTGVVAAAIIGIIFKCKASEDIRYVELCRETRIDKSRNFIPTPETNKQAEAVLRISWSMSK